MANANKPSLTNMTVLLSRIAVLVVAHLVKKSLGEDAVAVAAEGLADFAGEEITEKIQAFFAPEDRRRLIMKSFDSADKCFIRACEDGGEDNELLQAIISLPLAGAMDLQARMPTREELLDPSTISDIVHQTFSTYWGSQLSEGQLERATELYVNCLERSLASESTLILTKIYRKVGRLEANQELLIGGQRRLEVLGSEGFDKLSDEVESVQVAVSGLGSLVSQGLASKEENEAQNRLDEVSSAKLDQCKSLYEVGEIRTAMGLLNELRHEFEANPPDTLIRFRLHTLMGGCEFASNNTQDGIRHLEIAYELAPDNGIGLANLARARLIEGRTDDAISLAKRALESTDEETEARGILFQAEAAHRHFENLDDNVDEELLDEESYVRCVGFTFYQAGEMARARYFFEMSMELDGENPELKLALASAIADPHLTPSRSRLLDRVVEPENWKDDISASMDLVSEVLDEVGGSQRDHFTSQALAMRSGLQAAVGKMEDARSDCVRALELDPTNHGALHNLILLDMLDGDWGEVLGRVEALPADLRSDPSVVLAQIRALINQRELQAALDAIETACADGQILSNDDCFMLTADVLIRLDRQDQAEAMLEEYLVSNERTADVLDTAAFVFQSLGRTDDAVAALKEITETSPSHRERALAALRQFDVQLTSGHEGAALESLAESGINPLNDVALAKRAISAYLALGNLDEAEILARKIRVDLEIIDPNLISVEAYVADRLGRLDQALSLDEKLAELEPESPAHRIHAAHILYRLGRVEECATALDLIDITRVHDPQSLIQLGSLHLLFDRLDLALELAYRARRRAPGDPNVHMAYATIFLRVDEQVEGLDPDAVGSNSAVRLVGLEGEEDQWVVLLGMMGEEPDPAKWEFPVDSHYGELLVGKQQGEAIEVVGGPLDKRSFRIGTIQSVFVRAFQKTIQDFGARFPGHGGLQRMTLPEGDPQPFLTTVAGMSDRQKAIYDAYRRGTLTIEQFTMLVGRNRLDVMGSLIADEEKMIIASGGSHEVQDRQDTAALKAQSIALDFTALITLQYLELTDQAAGRYDRILIPQQVLDELIVIREERRFGLEKGMKSIAYRNGQFQLVEYSDETLESLVQLADNTIGLARQIGEIVGVDPKYSAMISGSNPKLLENGGKSTLSLIAVARAEQVPIYADDARLRTIAGSQYELASFWSQSFLRDLLNRGNLIDREYALACARLMKAGYSYTSVNRLIIMETLDDSNFRTTPSAVAVLGGLSGPDTNIGDAVRIAAEAIDGLWSSAVPGAQKILMLDNILNALARGRHDATLVVANLKIALRARSALGSPIAAQIDRQIDYWHAARSLVI